MSSNDSVERGVRAGDPFAYVGGKKKPRRFTEAECAEAIQEEEARRGYPLTDREREAFARGFHAPEYRADLEFLRAFGYGLLEDEEDEE